MLTLADFLLARIAEDEADARLVESEGRSSRYESVEDHGGWLILSVDPTRVLAECEAKRRIVVLHGRPHRCRMWGFEGVTDRRDPCDTLRALALPYADHPDYDEEWKP